jgi:hypothetical protein
MTLLYVNQALSFGVKEFEGLWKVQFPHPYDASLVVSAWLPMDPEDDRIGDDIDNIRVASPGVAMSQVMTWLYDRITKYPYYWPYEGTFVNKFSYDFQADITSDNKVTSFEITQSAYDIVKNKLSVQPPNPENPEVDIQYDTVAGGGVLVKLSVTLNRAQPVSELNLAPFTKYPLELVSLMYEEDIETFHPKKEIILPKVNDVSTPEARKSSQSTQSIRFQFPAVIAKRFTIILRQQNYVKDTYVVMEENIKKQELWDAISKREAEVTLDTTDGLETVSTEEVDKLSGWDIYEQQYAKYKTDLKKWQEDLSTYKKKDAERNAAIKAKAAEQKRYDQALSEYRADYNAAVKKYQTRVSQYKQDLAAYNAAYAKYQKDLTLYNKYLRDYSAWKKKYD